MKRQAGEFALIDWIRQRSPIYGGGRVLFGIGDDCAGLRFLEPADLVLSTDMLMEGRHFHSDDPQYGYEAIGYKALAVNLSDIAAMAAVPVAALVAVALPRTRPDIAHGLHQGMLPLCERFGVTLIGGDTNAWNGPLVISVTAVGEATSRGLVRRCGAQPGDAIFVTDALGGSILGRHMRPEPRVEMALALHKAAPIRAMIDVSDGLAADLGHILDESGGLGATLFANAIPIHPDAERLAASDGRTPLEHVLHDGEDFALCLTVAPDDAARLEAAPLVGITLYRVGVIDDLPGLRLLDRQGRTTPVEALGFDHFRD